MRLNVELPDQALFNYTVRTRWLYKWHIDTQQNRKGLP